MVPKTYRAANIQEAVALAKQFRIDGKYDCFRGQRNSNWKIQTSLARTKGQERAQAVTKFSRFYDWIKKSTEILPFIRNDEQIIAIAQHYGFRTPFLDFTISPDVAGYFAADNENDTFECESGVIFLVNSGDFKEFEKIEKNGMPIARFVHVDVEHLWRMQAQQGFFMECHCDLEQFYPPDRILFPHTKSKFMLNRRYIYPNIKSTLEYYIDGFFRQCVIEDGFNEILKKIPKEHQFWLDDNKEEIELATRDLEPWPLDLKWETLPDERWEQKLKQLDAVSPEFHFETADFSQLPFLIKERRMEHNLLAFKHEDENRQKHCQNLIDKIWTGMRLLPYSEDQIAISLKNMLKLECILSSLNLSIPSEYMPVISKFLNNPFEIEMGIVNGQSSRAVVPLDEIFFALKNATYSDFTLPNSEKSQEICKTLLNSYPIPRKIFDRDRLVEVFASSIIPWQVAYGRPFVVYSPYHIVTLGLP